MRRPPVRIARATPTVTIAVLAVVLGTLLLGPGAVRSASAAPAQPGQAEPVQLELLDQSGYVPSDGTFEATLAWTGPVIDHTVEAHVLRPVGEEDEVDEPPSGSRLNGVALPLVSLPRDPAGDLVLRLPIRSEPLPGGDPDRMYIPDPGVYPLRLEVTGPDGTTLASVSTHLIRLPVAEAAAEPVPVAVVLTIGGGGLSLQDGVALLERFPNVALTVLLDPSSVAGTRVDTDLVGRLRDAVGNRHLVAIDTVPLDLSALAEIGQLPFYDAVRRAGADQVARQLGRPVSTDVLLIERLPTPSAADHLADGVAVLLAPTGTDEGRLDTAAGPLPVLAAQDDLMEGLAGPANDAHRVLARLALRSRLGRTDPVVLAGRAGTRVTADALAVVLSGLSEQGPTRAVPVTEAARQPAGELEASERPQQDLRPAAELLAATVQDLEAYRTFHVDGPMAPQYLTDRVVAALSIEVEQDQRVDRLTAVRRELRDAFDVITLPEGRTVNLAATTSRLPLAVTSDAAGARSVRIAFASDKLTFPDGGGGSRLVEIPPGTASFDFVVESRSLGVFPVDVVVSTPDGARELARTRITIRSTAVPGLGLLLAGAALAFLVVWWARHVVRSRRAVPEVGGSERIA